MGIKFRMDGFEEMRRKLETLQRRVSNLAGPAAFEDLFPPEFMRRHTDCKTINDMFDGSGLAIESQEDFDRLSETDLDKLVQAKTRFKTWNAMKAQAFEEYAERRLGLDNL